MTGVKVGEPKIKFINSLQYKILKVLSYNRNLQTDSQISEKAKRDVYEAQVPNIFLKHISKYLDYKNKYLIDVGCGTGDFAITLAKTGAQKVVGIDIDKERIFSANIKVINEKVNDKVTFLCADFNTYDSHDLFDIAFSLSAFEHIPDPLSSLKEIYNCLIPGGRFCTIFGPLWGSPYGAHMWGFTSVPWVHFLFPEKVVLKIRTEYFRPDDPVKRYEEVRGHLNKITVKKFIQYAVQAGFKIEALRLNPAQDKGKYKLINVLINRLPIFRELCSFQIFVILIKPQ